MKKKLKMPEWSPERLKELADAESEALDATGGLLACSPEIMAEMKEAAETAEKMRAAGFKVENPRLASLNFKLKQREEELEFITITLRHTPFRLGAARLRLDKFLRAQIENVTKAIEIERKGNK